MPQLYPRFLFTLSCSLLTLLLLGQEVVRMGAAPQEVNTCGGTFVDSGGVDASHAPAGSRQSITICSDGTSAERAHVELDFEVIDISGTLTVRNGTTTGAPILRRITEADNSERIIVTATAVNASGCLTVEFVSTGGKAGWEAAIGCVAACQPITAELVSSTPAATPGPDGAIDLCLGDPLTLTARGVYAEAGAVYPQRDATTTFLWTFQDGTQRSGRTITHRYTGPGGYLPEVTLTDQRGCTNRNSIAQRVRVSGPPVVTPSTPRKLVVCPEERVVLGLSGADGADVTYSASPRAYDFGPPLPRAERIVIPETADEEQISRLPIRQFAQGQRLGSGDGIVQICVDIEHDFIGDLSVWVECPDGRRVDLMVRDPLQLGAEGQFFGNPSIEPNSPDAGTPGTYCWISSGGPTIDEVARSVPDNHRMPEDIRYRPAAGTFSDFSGCDLNGDWELHVLDLGSGNGGTVFNWSIEFQQKLLPADENFTIPITKNRFQDNAQLTDYTPRRITFTGATPGFVNQILTSTDSFGCSYDTLIPITVRSPYAADCFECPPPVTTPVVDTSICRGSSLIPQLALQIESAVDTVRWQASTHQPISLLNATPTAPFRSSLTVTDQVPTTFGEPSATLIAVCLDYQSSGSLTGLSITLISPAGSRLPLVRPGQVAGPTLRDCLVPGTGAPWPALRGQSINGDWTLEVSDTNPSNRGTLVSWSLDLVREPAITYRWSPAGPELSCTDCPSPTITPTQDRTYTLSATTADGCSGTASIAVTVEDISVDYMADIFAGCAGQDNGTITLEPVQPTSELAYRWSNGAATPGITDLSPASYGLTVTAPNGCQDSFRYTVPVPDPVVVNVTDVSPVACFGASTGSITTEARGGTPPYTYTWSDPSIAAGGDAGALPAGTYTLSVTDAQGCTADTTVTVTQPPPLSATLAVTPTPCRDGTDGALTIEGTGGAAPYTFRWSDGSTGPGLTGLAAGTYGVTVTDAGGCTLDTSATVTGPTEAFVIIIVDTLPPCAGGNNGRAAVFASGPSPVSYLWSSEENTPRATGLSAGNNSVTVTDENGCQRQLSFTLGEQAPVTPRISFTTSNLCNARVPRYLQLERSYARYRWSTGDTTARVTGLIDATTYAVTVTTATGCTAVDSFLYRAPPPITFAADITEVSCFGTRNGAITVNDLRGPLPGPYILEWGESTDFATGPTVSDLLAGAYDLRISQGANCRLDTTLIVSSPDLLVLGTRQRDISCFAAGDGSIRTLVSGGTLPYRFDWSTGATAERLDSLGPGSYRLTLTDANGCQDSTAVTLTSPGEITLAASARAGICGGQASGRIDLEATGGQEPYQYALGGAQFGPTPVFTQVNMGEYRVTVRDATGCSASTDVVVENGPELRIDLGEDIDLPFGDSVSLVPSITGATGRLDYLWEESDPGTLSCLTCPTPVAFPPYRVRYTVSVVDTLGCTAEDEIVVRVEKIREVAVPTGFSPNGDGRNDRLLVHGRPGTRVEELQVFDRWGGLVYHDAAGDWAVNDPTRGWDGRGPGDRELNAGVYIYKLTVIYPDDSRETLSGQTTLIR